MITQVSNRIFVESLTPREQQGAEAIARGFGKKQIAAGFGISTETVKRHLAALEGNEPTLEIYRLLGQWSLGLAAARLDPAVVKQIKRLIG